MIMSEYTAKILISTFIINASFLVISCRLTGGVAVKLATTMVAAASKNASTIKYMVS